jgi:glycosyltransferase involved in cell wall biosynthesis
MPKVSVIIPVYNVEIYLRECLDSVINQTLRDIEIICVNDASPDKCSEILSEYALKDDRIKIVTHENNQGLGPARNTGVSTATAEFIAFVDSDDFIANDMIENLYKAIISNVADMAWCGTSFVSEEGSVLQYEYIPEGIWNVSEMLENEQLYPGILPIWNKMYKNQLFQGIKQLPIISEDQPAIAEYLTFCEKIVTISEPLYYYRKRKGTLSNPIKNMFELWDHFFYSHELFFQHLRKGFTDTTLFRKQIILRNFSILWRIINLELMKSPTWKEQEGNLLQHIKRDRMQLKQACPVMFYYFICIFQFDLNLKTKEFFIKTGLKLSRGIWLKRSSFILLPLDMFLVFRPMIKTKLVQIGNKIEYFLMITLANAYKIAFTKKIWLIGERKDTAEENGIYFYSFLKRNQPQIKSYYIIDKKSIHYPYVKPYGKIIQYNSVLHKILFYASDYYVTSHYNFCFPEYVFGIKKMHLKHGTKNVFLQHGITCADVSNFYGKEKSDIDLFICGAKPEYNYVKEKFGYTNKSVKYTGFARFDGLHDNKVKRQILLMPTWRREFYDLLKDLPAAKDILFKKSAYFRHFQEIINNQELIRLLEEKDSSLVFYPHYEIQDYINNFSTGSNKITIASRNEYIIQDLLKDSALLITDISSVHFDFAYMKKPVIYYMFDYENYIRSHLKKGYFNNESMGFGPVVNNEKILLDTIEAYIKNEFRMEEKYSNRVLEFFTIHDRNNCKRIYDEISKL